MKHIYLAIAAIFFVFNLRAQSVAKFDDLYLAPASYWNGSDASGSFTSNGIKFYNSYNKEWNSWSGFAYSNKSDVNTPGLINQYSAITGRGNDGSSNYAVCYPVPPAIAEFATTTKVTGFYVTNTAYAYWSMKNGDAFSKKFGGENGTDPDYFKLTIEALDENDKAVDTVSFYLADFRFSDPAKDYILNKWAWVDLNDLKEARKLRFSLSSSDNSFGFMNTPAYFCIDDLNGEKPYSYQPVTYAGFEELNMGTQGYYNGSDKAGSFMSGNFRFMNDYNSTYGSWSGFAASAKTDATTPGYGNQYSAITGNGVSGSSSYGVAYPAPVSTITFKDTIVSGLYVTNNTYAYWSMKNGDAYSKKFGGESGSDKDWLKLTIQGFDANNANTGKVEFYLADYTADDPAKDYIVDSWKWVDLKSLGKISRLEFSLSSTDNSNWGMNTPAYFCIDNLNKEVASSSKNMLAHEISIYPNPIADQFVISGLKQNAKVSVLDITGRIVKEYGSVMNNQQINGMEGLKSGIYIVEITEGINRTGLRVIKK
ncbi:MAG: DUF4465 domain-containing protein [Candidatus Saccharibacteria bacterium]